MRQVRNVGAVDWRQMDEGGEPYIPPMSEQEQREVSRILDRKTRHMNEQDPGFRLERQQINRTFIFPERDDNYVMSRGSAVRPFYNFASFQFNYPDEDFFAALRHRVPCIRNIFVTARAFDDAIIEIEVFFNSDELRNTLLINRAEDIARALGTIVYRYIFIFYRMSHG